MLGYASLLALHCAVVYSPTHRHNRVESESHVVFSPVR